MNGIKKNLKFKTLSNGENETARTAIVFDKDCWLETTAATPITDKKGITAKRKIIQTIKSTIQLLQILYVVLRYYMMQCLSVFLEHFFGYFCMHN